MISYVVHKVLYVYLQEQQKKDPLLEYKILTDDVLEKYDVFDMVAAQREQEI